MSKALNADDDIQVYCEHCGGCGYIGCDGISDFLEAHVEGKTNCLNEVQFIDDIKTYFEIIEESEADRKKHELQARIDELSHVSHPARTSKQQHLGLDYLVEDRLKELKQELTDEA